MVSYQRMSLIDPLRTSATGSFMEVNLAHEAAARESLETIVRRQTFKWDARLWNSTSPMPLTIT